MNMNVSYEIWHLSARAHLWGITLCCEHRGETHHLVGLDLRRLLGAEEKQDPRYFM